jgi:urease accessory protein
MVAAPILLAVFLDARAAFAHGFGGSGLALPLTGLDHLLAMLAVGAWSAQLGGSAIAAVPAAFVAFMSLGGALGIAGLPLPWVEGAIALSVVVLGCAIAAGQRVAPVVAGAAVALFGTYHGFAHGKEVAGAVGQASYVAGFLVTTAGLHVMGAVAALLALESSRGATSLRLCGATTALVGGLASASLRRLVRLPLAAGKT